MDNRGRMKFFHFKAFRTYLYSYISIFFLILSLAAIFMMWQTAENMKEEDIRLMENKLCTIVEDLEIQMDAMQEIVMKVASAHIYSTDYFGTHKYNEIELLEDFSSYKRSTDICDSYFLRYNNVDTIFTSDESTIPVSIFFSRTGDEAQLEELAATMDRISREAAVRVNLYRKGDETLMLCPLKRYTVSTIGKEGLLGFRISESKVQERIGRIVGTMNGELEVQYNDFCILGADHIREDAEDMVEAVSAKGNIRICLYPEKGSYFSWGNVFSGKELLLFLGLTLLLFGVGYLLAYWNFRPLQRITEKYQEAEEGSSRVTAEWESLDRFIDSLLAGREESSKLFARQYQILREQTVQRIAQGGYSERVQEYMTLLNIRLEASVYGIILCNLAGEQSKEMHWESLYKDVEDLSGNGIVLYAYWNSGESLGVLVALEEEYQLQEAAELLYALFEVNNISVEIEVQSVSHEIEQLGHVVESDNSGNIDAFEPDKMPEEADGKTVEDNDGRNEEESNGDELSWGAKKNNATAQAALEYIESNSSDYDLSLELVAQKLQITPQHLSKIIKLQIGKSYKEYLTELRIDKAKKMLSDPQASVMDVCFESGYNNVSYFIKVFQKHTGKTPARYRDEYLN